MGRYFIEVGYRGTAYSGFQIQENAKTIQSEVEQAFQTLHRHKIELTGSSRTDAGVHALQNFFHFDFENIHPQAVYKMNAILPRDIVVRAIYPMHTEAHSRFDALSREYIYRTHQFKNPFLENASYYYPYSLDLALLQNGAHFLTEQKNFLSFSKTNSQVKNFECTILSSAWEEHEDALFYRIKGNRFLRGMVRLVTATLLRLGRKQISWQEFEAMFCDGRKAIHSVPPYGLYLEKINFPDSYFPSTL